MAICRLKAADWQFSETRSGPNLDDTSASIGASGTRRTKITLVSVLGSGTISSLFDNRQRRAKDEAISVPA